MVTGRVPFDVQRLVQRSTSGECFICQFVQGNPDYRHTMVAETEQAVAFLNRYPTIFGAVIVAPRKHLEHVTGDFAQDEYFELQKFIYGIAEAMRLVLSPERIYILSLGSQAANSHVHWHVAALPTGVPLEQQQYRALMHEEGVIETSEADLAEYAQKLRKVMTNAA
jgi:diadenosine tetraphosphate (Ap4A) HIT family hydrolase